MIYKSLIIYSYIFGYTLLTKYRNLLIFTIFFFPVTYGNQIITSKITSFWKLEFWISTFGDILPIRKKGCLERICIGVWSWVPCHVVESTWRVALTQRCPPPLLEVNVLWLDRSYEYVNLTIQLDRHRKRPFLQRNE